MANAGERIGRVRITSGANTIVSHGVLGNQTDDVVVMDDFLYAEPTSLALAGLGIGLMGTFARRSRRRSA